MASFGDIDRAKLEETRDLVRAALDSTSDARLRTALEASLTQFNSLLGGAAATDPSKFTGSVLYTIDDEEHPPYGRQVELRIFYHWIDYDPADEPYPVWGPTIEAIDVLAVRYFDDEGGEVTLEEHYLDAAWDLLHQQYERVAEACKKAGVIEGLGIAPSWYNPERPASASKMRIVSRLAPSLPTRAEQQRRQHG